MILLGPYDMGPGSPTEPVVVALEGELDSFSLSALAVLDDTVRAHPGAHVLVDLTDVTFLGAAALRAFARAGAAAEAGGGRLSFHGAGTFVRGLLELWHVGPVGPAVRTDDHPLADLPRPRSESPRATT